MLEEQRHLQREASVEVEEVEVEEGEGCEVGGRRCAFEAMRRIVFSMLMLGLMLGSPCSAPAPTRG